MERLRPNALGTARLADGAAFFTQGLVFISLTTRLPDVRDRWDFSEGDPVADPADDGRARRRRLGARRARCPLHRQRPRAACRAAAHGGGRAGAGAGSGVPRVRGGDGGLRRGAGRRGRLHQHAGGRDRAPLRPADPAVLPRHVDPRRHRRLDHHALDELDVLRVGGPGRAAAPGDRLCAVLRRDHGVIDADAQAVAEAVPWRPLLLVGAALVLFYMVDTAASTWGPTYLDDAFDTPSGLVALATLPYLVASGAMRLAGDTLVARLGPVAVLRYGALVAFGALGVIVLAPTWPIAVLGFTVLGLGVAVIAPLGYSAAAVLAGATSLSGAARQARVDAVIARFNQFNYVGALLGSVLTGLAGAGSLRVGFAVPLVLVLLLLPLAKAFAPAPAPAQTGISAQ